MAEYDDEYDDFDDEYNDDFDDGNYSIRDEEFAVSSENRFTPVYDEKPMNYWEINPAGKLELYTRLLANSSVYDVDKLYELKDAMQEALDYLEIAEYRMQATLLMRRIDQQIREIEDLDIQEERIV
jgi:hypothetical protein